MRILSTAACPRCGTFAPLPPVDAQTVKKPGPKTLRFVMQTTLSLARLNPLVNLDTVILLSGGARQYADSGFAF